MTRGKCIMRRDEGEIQIAVCIASFNRRENTIACLRSLERSCAQAHCSIDVYLFDDASSDGTAAAVREAFPAVTLLHGDGNQFWAGGMRKAYDAAIAKGYDFYVWLNDDVELLPHALSRALSVHKKLRCAYGGQHLIVGAMQDPATGRTSYSGYARSSALFPWLFCRVEPDPLEAKQCATINGNFVLISDAICRATGSINPAYTQTYADWELGLKAGRTGARNWMMPGYAGLCKPNTKGRFDYKKPGLKFRDRVRIMEHPLGHPFRANLAYAKNFGAWAPVIAVIPYLTIVRVVIFQLIPGWAKRLGV